MKNLFSILLLTVVALGCSKDDENVINDEYLGTWTLEERIVNNINVPISSCDTDNSRLTLVNSDKSTWEYCSTSSEINKIPLKLKQYSNGDLIIELSVVYEGPDGRILLDHQIKDGVLEFKYHKNELNSPTHIDRYIKK